MRNVDKKWSDWSVKNVYRLVKDSKKLADYLPIEEMNEGYYPDKIFFWGIVFTIEPEWSNKYYEAVLKKRHGEHKKFECNPKTINISNKWKDEMKEYDFKSKSR